MSVLLGFVTGTMMTDHCMEHGQFIPSLDVLYNLAYFPLFLLSSAGTHSPLTRGNLSRVGPGNGSNEEESTAFSK